MSMNIKGITYFNKEAFERILWSLLALSIPVIKIVNPAQNS